MSEGKEDEEGLGGENKDGSGDSDALAAAKKLAEAIEQIGQAAGIAVSTMNDKVVVDLNAQGDTPTEMKKNSKKLDKLSPSRDLLQVRQSKRFLWWA